MSLPVCSNVFSMCVCGGGGSNQGVPVWGSLSRGVSVLRVSGGVSVQRRGLCPEEGSLSRGGVSVQRRGLCPEEGSLSRGGVSFQRGSACPPPHRTEWQTLLKTLPSLAVGKNELKQFRIQNSWSVIKELPFARRKNSRSKSMKLSCYSSPWVCTVNLVIINNDSCQWFVLNSGRIVISCTEKQ